MRAVFILVYKDFLLIRMLQNTDNELQQHDFPNVDNALIFPPNALSNICSDWNFTESLCQPGQSTLQEKEYNFGSYPCNCTSLQGNFPDASWNMGYQFNQNQFNSSTCCLFDQGKRQADVAPPQVLNDLESASFVKDFIDNYSGAPKQAGTSNDCRSLNYIQPQNVYNPPYPSQDMMYPPYNAGNASTYGFCVDSDCIDKLCSPTKTNFSSCLLDQNVDVTNLRTDTLPKVSSDGSPDLSSLISINNDDPILRVESDDDSDIIVEDSDTESEVSIDVGPYIADKEVEKVVVMRCFICNLSYSEQYESNFVHVNSSFPLTFVSQTPVMLKLLDIIPIDMHTSVKFENTLICRRCLNLIDMIESLEVRLVSVKKAICDYVTRASKDITIEEDLNLIQGSNDMCINYEDNIPKDTLMKENNKDLEPGSATNKRTNLVSTGVNTDNKTTQQENKETVKEVKLAEKKVENLVLQVQEIKLHQCDRCGKLFKREKELNYHLSKHAGKFKEKCKDCGKGFMKLRNLEIHMRKHRVHVCLNCRASFETETDLTSHLLICNENKFPCQECTLIFNSEEKLKNHLEKHNKNPIICSICNKTFKHPSYLEAHMSSHSQDKPFSCDKCGKTYKNQSHLRRHQKSHDFPFQCTVCRSMFSTALELDCHSLQHTERVKCDECDKTFQNKVNLLEHKKVHSGTQPKKECPVCKKLISSKFKAHVLSHSEEKAFKCQICGTEFTFKQSLNKHMKSKHK